MATLTVNVASPASLSISGNTQKTTTISWTCPSVPSGAIISSCTLTGKATASMSKGSATITVNGTTVSSGSNFTINLGTGNTTSSVTVTAKGGNKNASGTVTFSNLVYTVNYSIPLPKYTVTFVDWNGAVLKTQEVEEGSSAIAPSNPTRTGYVFTGWDKTYTNITSNLTITAQYSVISVLKIKEGNNWINATKIYKRVNGNWVEQSNSNWENLFDVNAAYNNIKMNYFAILYSDGSLVFQHNNALDSTHGEVVEIYDMNIFDTYDSSSSIPWYSNKANIKYVYTMDDIRPADTHYWFNGCTRSTSFSLNKLNTSNVTNMMNMFYNCTQLTSLDVSHFDTSKVTNMESMFYGCWGLTSLDVSNFDTSNVTNMSGMFEHCRKLTGLDVSNFDTSNVTNMMNMFYFCDNLTSLDVSHFDTSKVTNMGGMFEECMQLTSLDVSNFDTSNVTNMSFMFYFCDNLTSLDLSNFDTSKVTNMLNMFAYCDTLTSIDLSSFDITKVTNSNNMFNECTNPDLKIYVKDEAMADWVKATSNFPSTATVIVGSMN